MRAAALGAALVAGRDRCSAPSKLQRQAIAAEESAVSSRRGGAADPMTLADFPRVPLTFGPSPVHRLDRLTEHLGGRVEIWAKREDCNSGLAYGGNKVRKLEYLAADALAQGCDTLVSIGGVQSNHTRQVAAVAAHLGLGCLLVQEHWVEWDDPVYEGSATSCCRGSWAPTCASRRPASTSASVAAGRRPSPRSRPAAASRIPSRPAPPIIRWAATALPAGRMRWPPRRPSSGCSSTRSSSVRSRARRRPG